MKLLGYLNARRTSAEAPFTVSDIQGGLRACRGFIADEVRVVIQEVIADDPTLASIVKL